MKITSATELKTLMEELKNQNGECRGIDKNYKKYEIDIRACKDGFDYYYTAEVRYRGDFVFETKREIGNEAQLAKEINKAVDVRVNW